jgi:hypothetical protein
LAKHGLFFIRSVQDYFDSSTKQRQLGLEVVADPAEPQRIIPFGSVVSFQSGKNVRPGAISLTLTLVSVNLQLQQNN